MPTQEIPRAQWNNFFDSFSRQHEGWLVTLEVFGSTIGAQQEVRQIPFEEIIVEHGNSQSLVIILGKSRNHFSHTIKEPKHVWIQRTPKGADESLEIEDEDDTKVLLRFRSTEGH